MAHSFYPNCSRDPQQLLTNGLDMILVPSRLNDELIPKSRICLIAEIQGRK